MSNVGYDVLYILKPYIIIRVYCGVISKTFDC